MSSGDTEGVLGQANAWDFRSLEVALDQRERTRKGMEWASKILKANSNDKGQVDTHEGGRPLLEMTKGQRSPLAQPLLGRGEQEGSENISGSHQGGRVLGLSLPEAISAKVEKPWPCLQEEPDRKVCDLRQNPCFSAEVGQGPWAQLQAPGHQQQGRGAGFPWARCSHPPHLDSTALILQHREKIIRKKNSLP